MFKRISIELTGPICNCEHDDLGWQIVSVQASDQTFRNELLLSCATCGTRLQVGHPKFVATFNLEKPYPKGHKPSPEDTKTEKPKVTGSEGNVVKVDFSRTEKS